MNTMLALGKVKEVQRLLAEGKLSQRKIAKAVGVGRCTVSLIARGRRPDYDARIQARAAELEPLGPIERCPSCGGRVYMPCRLCRVRKIKAGEQARRRALALSSPPAGDPVAAASDSRSRTEARRRGARSSGRAA